MRIKVGQLNSKQRVRIWWIQRRPGEEEEVVEKRVRNRANPLLVSNTYDICSHGQNLPAIVV